MGEAHLVSTGNLARYAPLITNGQKIFDERPGVTQHTYDAVGTKELLLEIIEEIKERGRKDTLVFYVDPAHDFTIAVAFVEICSRMNIPYRLMVFDFVSETFSPFKPRWEILKGGAIIDRLAPERG